MIEDSVLQVNGISGENGISAETKNTTEKVYTGFKIDRTNATSRLLEEAIFASSQHKIPYSEFMAASLFGPEGYYSSGKAKIGKGDFVTCVTLSEYFGATMGGAAMQVWEKMGRPEKFNVIEMGAGNGMLAKDIITWAKTTEPEFYNALQYTILEYGELIPKQRKTVSGRGRISPLQLPGGEEDLKKVRWVQGSATELPFHNVEGVFISNELSDANPVEIVKLVDGEIKQKYVTIENDEWVESWGEPAADVREYIKEYNIDLQEDLEEPINLLAIQWQKRMDKALRRGAILTSDYGKYGSVGIRGKRATRIYPNFRGEQVPCAEYRSPGDVDITTDVNFAVLGKTAVADGLEEAFNGRQSDFLLRSGFGVFIEPTVVAIEQTPSLTAILKLEASLLRHKGSLGFQEDPDLSWFTTQVLTKGITFSPANPNPPSAADLFGSRLKLTFRERPKSISVETITSEGKPRIDIGKLIPDEDGNFVFKGTDLGILSIVSDVFPHRIRDEAGNVLLDSRDKKRLRSVMEQSGYTWDQY